ncbi:MAG: Nin1 binding protein, partial [Paramarteilia canceri]
NNVIKIITTNSVLREIKSKHSRELLDLILPFIEVSNPTDKSIKDINQLITKKQIRSNLSCIDIELLALTYELDGGANSKSKMSNKDIDEIGFFKGGSDEPDSGWIVPSSVTKDSSDTNVILLTADNSMQNVGLALNLLAFGINGSKIKEVSYFIKVCSYCGIETKGKVYKFCENCGRKGIRRVRAFIDKNGEKKMRLSKNYKLNKSQIHETLEPFKGGKHPNMGKLSEGHRVIQNKLPRKFRVTKDVWNDDFGLDGQLFSPNETQKLNKKLRRK